MGVCVAVAAAVGLTCTAPAEREPARTGEARPPEATAGAATCTVRADTPEPALSPLGQLAAPASRLSLGVNIPVERLAAEIAAKVPRGLGSARRQPIGSAGEVTYDVSRGGFSFGVKGDRLLVSTPVHVNVSVCKPFGPLCPTYGRCTPKLSATASVPLALGSDYRIDKSAASYSIVEGCSIVGMDVTSKIRGIADARIGDVRARIDRAIPDVTPHARQLVELLSTPRPLGDGCATIAIQRVEQAKPRIADGVLSLRAVGHGLLSVTEAGCLPAAKTALPAIEKLAEGAVVSPESVVATSLDIPYAELSRQLNERAKTVSLAGGTTLREVTVRGGERDQQPILLVGVTLEGATCGTVYASARVDPSLTDRTLRLSDVTPFPDQVSVEGLAEALEALTVPFPKILARALAEVSTFEKLVRDSDDDLPVTLDMKLDGITATATPHAPGVMILLRRSGTIGGTLTSK